MMTPLAADVLPPGIRARSVDNVNGLSMHILEAGHDAGDRPMLLLLHGFPELAFSWRHVMPALAAGGYHVVAPDQRGYGRTTGWTPGYDVDLDPFRMIGLATDALALVDALGRREVAAVVGHDFGSPVAAWCAIARPDVFRAAVLMSAPFPGTPRFGAAAAADNIHRQLAALPRPRKPYVGYYATRDADADMRGAPQGLAAFLRAYYHGKSGDWAGNAPFPLAAWTAAELARMPTYYIMDAAAGMAETVAPLMPSPAEIAACHWLTDAELAVYAGAFDRTGFQGALNWYRATIDGGNHAERLFAGRRIDVPCTFIAGAMDWGIHQRPGALATMAGRACSDYRGTVLVDGAGHWVQQEQPDAVVRAIIGFMAAA